MPKPNPRRDGREAAVQFLFSTELQEITEDFDLQSEFAEFWLLRQAGDSAKELAEGIVEGALENLASIDLVISNRLDNFDFDRLTKVDRNILRVGVYEICFADYIPRAAAINEAIEIAKRFGTEESAKFVNGVLDGIEKSDIEKL